MKIGSNLLADRPFEHFLVARNRKTVAHKKNLIIGLTLTSMVDMFSLLVIFLLQTFSASPEILVMGKGVTLPTSASSQEPKDALVLAISSEGVFLDQKKIGDVQQLLARPEPLMDVLEEHKLSWMKVHPTEAFKGEVTLQADKGIDSTVISQFMALLPGQSYGSIQLAVISSGGV